MNKAMILGRVGQDPEIRTMQSGDKVANLSIATTESWKDKQTGEKKEATEWHRVVIFGKMAETVERFVRKGNRVLVEGKIKTRSWDDQSGNKKYSTEIVLNGYDATLQIIDWPEQEQSAHNQSKANGYQSQDGLDDEIPF